MTIRKLSLALSSVLLLTSANWAFSKQICQNHLPASTPVQRFNDQGNGTLIDTYTGLMWKKCLEGQTGERCVGQALRIEWSGTAKIVQSVNHDKFAGHTDWRLPTLDELNSIVEKRCVGPAANLELFPGLSAIGLWSSNQSDSLAWSIDFEKGRAYENFKGAGMYIRLVRNLR